MYRLYKALQRAANINYPKIMVGVVFMLAVLSNTFFSLIFISILSWLMYQNSYFLDVKRAKRNLLPLIKYFLMPSILFEVFLHFLYQLPLDYTQMPTLLQLTEVLGIVKYWDIGYLGDKVLNKTNWGSQSGISLKIFQIMCKAFIYFFLYLQM